MKVKLLHSQYVISVVVKKVVFMALYVKEQLI